jgi:hypothetical protein
MESSLKPLVCFERSPVPGKRPGSPAEREAFLERFPGILKSNSAGYQFNAPGVFQIGMAPPILVLPWFLADVPKNSPHDSNDPAMDILNAISEIQYAFENDVGMFASAKYLGSEMLFHSFLTALRKKVEDAIKHNYFNERTENLSSIRGKWLVAKDISMSPTPTRFTCEYADASPDNPILRCVRILTTFARRILSAAPNLACCDEIDTLLADIFVEESPEAAMTKAFQYIDSNPRFHDWRVIIQFGESLYLSRDDIVDKSGTAYHFPMDRFFEELVARVYRFGGGVVRTQARSPLLGKSEWISETSAKVPLRADDDGSHESATESQSTTFHSRPDVVFTTSTHYLVIECKYKPLEFPGIPQNSPDLAATTFGRNDRNQVLSFLLSIVPDSEVCSKILRFVVVYPYVGPQDVRHIDLVFPQSELRFSEGRKTLTQHTRAGEEKNLNWKIRFIGINMQSLIASGGKPLEKAISQKIIELSKQ